MNSDHSIDETIDSTSLPGSIEATTDFVGPNDQSSGKPSSGSVPVVRLISGVGKGFRSETASLLRSRLIAYSIMTFGILMTGFVATLVNPAPLVGLRLGVLGVMAVAFSILRSDRLISLSGLRWIESACVTALLIQVTLMAWLRIADFVRQDDVVSAVIASQFLHNVFTLVIVAYGFFVPNSWRRAAVVMLPMAALPAVILILARIWLPGFTEMLGDIQLTKPIPETLVAAVIAIYGSHVIQGVRREAFKAKQLGQYVLKEAIGSGGMGDVYRAEHRMLKRPCAIKLIRPDSKTSVNAINRFEMEVQSTALLSHWNSIEIYDYGRTEDGTFYYVMELLPGASLEEIVQRHGPLPPGRVIHFLTQICDALHEAHSQGLVHRDIKPANLFASRRGGIDDVAKLLDFGLVRHSDHSTDGQGSFSGTPHYMPPEQATDYEHVEARADIYALGAVAHYLLTGQPPFPGSINETLNAHQRDPPRPPSAINSELPIDLDQVILRCLKKSPSDRYQEVVSLRTALLACKSADQWDSNAAADWWEYHSMAPSAASDSSTPHSTDSILIKTLD